MTVAELDTKPLLEVRGLKMHFPVTDLTRTVRPHLCETRRHSRLALGRGYRGDRRDVRQILLDCLFSSADDPAASAGSGPIISSLDPRSSSSPSLDQARASCYHGSP